MCPWKCNEILKHSKQFQSKKKKDNFGLQLCGWQPCAKKLAKKFKAKISTFHFEIWIRIFVGKLGTSPNPLLIGPITSCGYASLAGS